MKAEERTELGQLDGVNDVYKGLDRNRSDGGVKNTERRDGRVKLVEEPVDVRGADAENCGALAGARLE